VLTPECIKIAAISDRIYNGGEKLPYFIDTKAPMVTGKTLAGKAKGLIATRYFILTTSHFNIRRFEK
jgi:hypothetical protein